MNKGIIYFIQPTELLETNRYKIGCSNKNDLDRCKHGYKKGSRYLCIMECNNPFELENKIKKYFKSKFKLIAGSEYFEGNECIMIVDFINIVINEYKLIDNNNINNNTNNNININNSNIEKICIDSQKNILLIEWFNDKFELTNNKKDLIKLKYIYDIFIYSDYYKKIIELKNNKYTKKQFISDIEKINYFSNYYYKNNGIMKNFLKCWIIKSDEIDISFQNNKHLINFNGDITPWFKDTFELTVNKNDTLKVKDIYEIFKSSNHYDNMTKIERKKYNKSYFVNYIETNKFFNKYYCSRSENMRTFIRCWKLKDNDNDLDN